MLIRNLWLILGCSLAILSSGARAEEEKKLNIYNWSDYIAPETITNFQKETGIKVQYDVYDSNQLLESKLMAGKTGYDIVVPSAAPFLARQIKLGFYQPLSKSKFKNYNNLDKKILKLLSVNDPDNAYSIPWMWGTVGIGYNVKKIKAIMPDAPISSLSMLFDPKIAGKFAACGIGMLDSPTDIIPNALLYTGINPNSQKPEDLKKAEEIMMAIRPSVRQFHSSKYIDDMANGDMCLVLGFSGDIIQASNRAREAKNGVEVAYILPKEGAQLYIDAMAIPKDAPHPENAHKFLDYIMKPKVVALSSNLIGYANANSQSYPLLKAAIRDNKQIYPPDKVMEKMYSLAPSNPAFDRLRTRAWTHILTGN